MRLPLEHLTHYENDPLLCWEFCWKDLFCSFSCLVGALCPTSASMVDLYWEVWGSFSSFQKSREENNSVIAGLMGVWQPVHLWSAMQNLSDSL